MSEQLQLTVPVGFDQTAEINASVEGLGPSIVRLWLVDALISRFPLANPAEIAALYTAIQSGPWAVEESGIKLTTSPT